MCATRRRQVPQVTGGALTLFSTAEPPEPYKKAVPILHSKPKTHFSLVQRKSANALLKHAYESEQHEDGFFEIGISRLRKDIGLNSNNFEHLRASVRQIVEIIFEWDVLNVAKKGVQFKASAMFPEIEVTASHFRYQVSSEILKILKRAEVYALIDLAVVRRFKRASALAIWEFAIRFEKIGKTTEMPWTAFRDMILSDAVARGGTYQEYKYFKAKQLKPAIQEVNQLSDHTIQLVELKKGKSVETIYFEVARKRAASNDDIDPEDLPVLKDLKTFGLKQEECVTLVRQYGRERIADALMATHRRAANKKMGPLESPAGYLRWRLRSGPSEAEPHDALKTGAKKPQVDLREQFLAHRRKEAEQYFQEIGPEAQASYMKDYDEQQTVPALRIQGKRGAAAADSFFRWLAQETWGEATAEQILEYAQQNWAGK